MTPAGTKSLGKSEDSMILGAVSIVCIVAVAIPEKCTPSVKRYVNESTPV